MIIDEAILDDGSLRRTYLSCARGRVHIRDGGGLSATLPFQAVVDVMEKCANPLDDTVVVDSPVLALSEGVTLQTLRFHAPVDAEARDYLVLNVANKEPIAALSIVIAAELRALASR